MGQQQRASEADLKSGTLDDHISRVAEHSSVFRGNRQLVVAYEAALKALERMSREKAASFSILLGIGLIVAAVLVLAFAFA